MKQSFDIFSVPYSFIDRPEPVPGELRPQWRLVVILLILNASRQKKASIKKLHVLNWAIRSSIGRRDLIPCLKGEIPPWKLTVRFEPALTEALNLGRAEGLWDFVGGKAIQLTAKGITGVQALQSVNDCLETEKQFIEEIKPYMTESKMESLLTWEGL